MKKISLYIVSLLSVASLSISCTDMLTVSSKTDITTDYIFESADGLSRAAVGLYALEREIFLEGSDACAGIVWMCDPCTDISVFRANNPAGGLFWHLDGLAASDESGTALAWWQGLYMVIGKANEIISAAETLGLDDAQVLQAWAEAKTFRARGHFELWKKYENIILSNEPTSTDNLNPDFSPATRDEIFALVEGDLDDVIAKEALGWEPISALSGNTEYGRLTMATVKHVRAQVAMWQKDWTTALSMSEDIFAQTSTVDLMDSTMECFNAADLNVKENIYVIQFSTNTGGGNTVSSGEIKGHRFARYTTPQYNNINGMDMSVEYGAGGAWGRAYPNTHLLDLYPDGDVRRTEMFRTEWQFTSGALIGETAVPYQVDGGSTSLPSDMGTTGSTTTYFASNIKYIFPQNLKYYDPWTNASNVERTSNFKDIVIYRLAETYLIAAEAALMGGNSANATTYFKKIYDRSNPDNPFAGTVTMDDIVDEYARELNFEGVRWGLLKRLDLLETKVTQYAGDLPADNIWIENTTANQEGFHARARAAFDSSKYVRWPIPQEELDLMDGYPQNSGY